MSRTRAGRFLVIGCRGLLGGFFMRRLGPGATGVDLPEFDLAGGIDSIARLVSGTGAETVINCAALTDVDYCETHRDEAFRLHASAVADLAAACPRLATFSTDHVFTGPSTTPFAEGDRVSPANAYAESKLAGEAAALASPSALVIRTSWLFARGRGMVPWVGSRLEEDGFVRAVEDQTACVTYAPDLVAAVLSMLSEGVSGLVHAVNAGPATPYSIACELAGGDGGSVEPVRWRDLGLPARRPVYSALRTITEYVLPGRGDAIERWRMGDES